MTVKAPKICHKHSKESEEYTVGCIVCHLTRAAEIRASSYRDAFGRQTRALKDEEMAHLIVLLQEIQRSVSRLQHYGDLRDGA